jgi:hypothetical protein
MSPVTGTPFGEQAGQRELRGWHRVPASLIIVG